MRISTDKVANVLTIAVCLLALPVLVTHAQSYFAPKATAKAVLGHFPLAEKLDFGTHDKVVLALVSSSCRFCTESMPVFRRLKDSVRGASLVFASNDSSQELTSYLAANGLGSAKSLSLGKRELLITSTPTTLVVSKDGTITGAWKGALTSDQESAIVETAGGR